MELLKSWFHYSKIALFEMILRANTPVCLRGQTHYISYIQNGPSVGFQRAQETGIRDSKGVASMAHLKKYILYKGFIKTACIF